MTAAYRALTATLSAVSIALLAGAPAAASDGLRPGDRVQWSGVPGCVDPQVGTVFDVDVDSDTAFVALDSGSNLMSPLDELSTLPAPIDGCGR